LSIGQPQDFESRERPQNGKVLVNDLRGSEGKAGRHKVPVPDVHFHDTAQRFNGLAGGSQGLWRARASLLLQEIYRLRMALFPAEVASMLKGLAPDRYYPRMVEKKVKQGKLLPNRSPKQDRDSISFSDADVGAPIQ
jgi:hypothetical protein